MRFGLVLGWLVVLKISDWAVKYATFDDNFIVYSWAKNYLALKKILYHLQQKSHIVEVRETIA